MNTHIVAGADFHFCPERADDCLASLAALRDEARERKADLVTLSGDLFDRGLQATNRDAYTQLIRAIQEILEIAPIAAISGTVTHDPPGAYDVLTQLQGTHRLTLLEPGKAYFLVGGEIQETEPVIGDATLVLLGIPEPGKTWLLANRNGLDREGANQAVVDAMKALLLGLGGLRRQHPDLATLLLYHGSVRGATMSGGQIVGSNEIAVGREDLEMVGSDLVLMGHIHEPQAITPRMHYCGSAYHVDWGETTQRTFLSIEILDVAEHPAIVERIPFPHAPRVKLVLAVADMEDSCDHEVSGRQAWLVVRDTAEEIRREGVDEERALAWLTLNGALPGSRVTFEPIPVETVRAREITEAQRLRDKVVIWAEASGLPEPIEGVLAKADSLEAEARQSGAVGAGAHIRLQRLRLRGAIGVWAGLGVDEITLDLDDYEAGLLALVGPNGVGKSTLIENLHVYPELLTRGGSLQSHFRLKDSCRELWFVDEALGIEYRALILLDPTLATPKAEYHLYQIDKAGEIPLTNGRKEDYFRAITGLWGSLDLFLRSAFVSQKPPRGHPDLADATPAERKALFRELGGLDYLQAYAESAKAKADSAESTIEVERGKASVIRPLLTQEPDRRRELETTEAALAEERSAAEALVASGLAQKAAADTLEARVAEQREIGQKRAALGEERGRLNAEHIDLTTKIVGAEKALASRAGAQSVVQQAEDLQKAKESLSEQKTIWFTDRERIATKHAAALAAHRHDREAIQAEIRSLEKAAADVGARKATAVAQIDHLELEVAKPITDTCPTCGQDLPEPMRDGLRQAQAQKRAALVERQEQALGYDNLLTDNAAALAGVEKRLAALHEPPAPVLASFGQEAALDTVLAALKALDLSRARETIRLADAAEAQIASAKERAGHVGARIAEIDGERGSLLGRIDERIEALYIAAKVALDKLREQYTAAQTRIARSEATAEGIREILADLARKRESLAEIEAGIERAAADLSDWRYLERACGRDGIQALELDAMGPGITETANGLLDAAYGSRFRVEIRTTRIAGKGSKTKQVEDFELIVKDTERGTEQPLDTLSGGETVWIRKALYAAFGIVRARNTGTRFLTCMLDEADGALDPDARRRYVAMLKAEHAAAGRAHTIVISHSEDAQEAIGQRVEMRELAREGVPV